MTRNQWKKKRNRILYDFFHFQNEWINRLEIQVILFITQMREKRLGFYCLDYDFVESMMISDHMIEAWSSISREHKLFRNQKCTNHSG